jgi:lipopolysaccharide/colanic/teichoic acid biosynthesis glycosyltransferase
MMSLRRCGRWLRTSKHVRSEREGQPRVVRIKTLRVKRSFYAEPTVSLTLRRLFDVLCAAAGLILLSPVIAAIALAIMLDDGGPVIYSQPRIGKDFRRFRVLKFRTMIPHADRFDPLTSSGDPRVTRVGRLLRRYKLDELPQLVNVLIGDMQLVGSRPELERYVEMFRDPYARILRDRPGITDPATLAYRHEEEWLESGRVEEQYVSEVLPRKLELSLEYMQQRTFLSDLGMLIRTVLHIPWVSKTATSLIRARSEPKF